MPLAAMGKILATIVTVASSVKSNHTSSPMPLRTFNLMSRYVPLLCCLVVMIHGGPALAQGIIGEDNRVIVVDKGAPWDAIGQVNIGGFRMLELCTGTLVAPNLVITAAHCVMNPWEKTPFLLRNIHFLAGVRGSSEVQSTKGMR